MWWTRSEEHTSELQSHSDLVCRLLLEKKKKSHEERGCLQSLEVALCRGAAGAAALAGRGDFVKVVSAGVTCRTRAPQPVRDGALSPYVVSLARALSHRHASIAVPIRSSAGYSPCAPLSLLPQALRFINLRVPRLTPLPPHAWPLFFFLVIRPPRRSPLFPPPPPFR